MSDDLKVNCGRCTNKVEIEKGIRYRIDIVVQDLKTEIVTAFTCAQCWTEVEAVMNTKVQR